MNAHSNVAPMAHDFDPQIWLNDFKANGGYWFAVGDKITIGVMLDGDQDKEATARDMLNGLSDNAAVKQALRAHILASAGEA